MKIFFEKYKDRYRPIYDEEYYGFTSFPQFSSDKTTIYKLNDTIEDLFASVKIDIRLRSLTDRLFTAYYTFMDPADEAAFLLWSSEGVEI